MIDFLIGFFLFGGSLGIIFYLFDKLTANNIPANLRGYSNTSATKAVIMLVLLFGIALAATLLI